MRPLRFLTGLVGSTIKLALTLTGVALIIAGIILTITLIGAIVGVPLIILGVFVIGIGALFTPRREIRYVYAHEQPAKKKPKKLQGPVVEAEWRED